MKTLSENTAISLGLAIIVIGGGSAWFTLIRSDVTGALAEVSELKQDFKDVTKRLESVEKELVEIHTMLRAQDGLSSRSANTAFNPKSISGLQSKITPRLKRYE